MADLVVDPEYRVGKSMGRLSTNTPDSLFNALARYEGVFQSVLNEVHAPDIRHGVYTVQGPLEYGDSTTASQIMAFQNPLGVDGYVISVEIFVDVRTTGSGAIGSIGVSNQMKGRSVNLIDSAILFDAVGMYDNLVTIDGASGRRVQPIGANAYITMYLPTGRYLSSLAGLVGSYSFQFVAK